MGRRAAAIDDRQWGLFDAAVPASVLTSPTGTPLPARAVLTPPLPSPRADAPAAHSPSAGVAPVGTAAGAAAPVRIAPAPAPAPAPDRAVSRHPRAEREITLADHLVGYALKRSRRRSIGFIVGAEGLSVNAPKWVGINDIEVALREKAGWILRKLQEQRHRAARLLSARVDWRDGTTIPFLGENVIVVLDPRARGAVLNTGAVDAAGRPGAAFASGVNDIAARVSSPPATPALPGVAHLTLHVGLPHGAAPEQIRDVVQSWLQRQARRIFEERCAFFAQQLGVRVRRLSLSSAQTRWGSASADGSIRLNWRLVHFAMASIDYVVAHELAHLREMNHSPRFWDVVRSVLPDFEQARGTLKDGLVPVLD
jgi:predicted metal-dependent hydrolase